MRPLERRERLTLAAIFAVALWLRLLFLLEQRHDLLFDYPVIDEERYVAMGRGLAMGYVEPRAWFHPPGLVYALSVVFRVFGDGLLAPRVVQALVSSASCLLAFAVARRLFGVRVAIGTALLCALHGVLVFESCELLPPTWILATDLVALWLLLVAGERRTPAAALACGVAFGVAAVFAPTILPFVLVAAAWLRKPALALALVLGTLAPIAPVTYGNWERSHELVLVSSNGGLNFYLGNNADSEATLAIRPGHRWEALMDEPSRAGAVGPAAASSYFTHQALAFIRAEPLRAAGAFARKDAHYVHGAEEPRDTDIYAAREGSPLLSVLVTPGPLWWPDGVLVPLAIVGAVASWRRRRELFVAYAFVAVQALVTAAFFVTSRYRVPTLPVLAMFACAGTAALVTSLRDGSPRARLVLLAQLALLVFALNVPVREAQVSYAAELDFYRGLASTRHERDVARGVAYFERAAARDGSDARLWFELGNALDGAGRKSDAVVAWSHAADRDPWDSRPRRRMASTLAQSGQLEAAIAALRANVAAHAHEESHYAPDHLELSLLLARAKEPDAAALEVRAALASDPSYVRANVEGFVQIAVREAASAPRTDALEEQPFLEALAMVCTEVGQPGLVHTVRAAIADAATVAR